MAFFKEQAEIIAYKSQVDFICTAEDILLDDTFNFPSNNTKCEWINRFPTPNCWKRVRACWSRIRSCIYKGILPIITCSFTQRKAAERILLLNQKENGKNEDTFTIKPNERVCLGYLTVSTICEIPISIYFIAYSYISFHCNIVTLKFSLFMSGNTSLWLQGGCCASKRNHFEDIGEKADRWPRNAIRRRQPACCKIWRMSNVHKQKDWWNGKTNQWKVRQATELIHVFTCFTLITKIFSHKKYFFNILCQI